MAFIDSAFRVHYESKNFQSGLTDVYVKLARPDNTIIGPFPLTENAGDFAGTYGYVLNLPVNALVGEWVGIIVSPTESVKSSFRFNVSEGGIVSGSGDCDDSVTLEIKSNPADLKVNNNSNIELNISSGLAKLSAEPINTALMALSQKIVDLKSDLKSVTLEIECDL